MKCDKHKEPKKFREERISCSSSLKTKIVPNKKTTYKRKHKKVIDKTEND